MRSRGVDGSQEDPAADVDQSQNGAVEDAAAHADRLFASLIGEVENERNGVRPEAASAPAPPPKGTPVPAAPPAETPARPEKPAAARPAPAVDRELHDLVLTTLALIERMGAVVDTTTTDVAALGEAVTLAFEATNERLASLEFVILGEGVADSAGVEQAMSRLRSVLQQPAEGGDDGAEAAAAP